MECLSPVIVFKGFLECDVFDASALDVLFIQSYMCYFWLGVCCPRNYQLTAVRQSTLTSDVSKPEFTGTKEQCISSYYSSHCIGDMLDVT
jgi:hypothetical protein